MRGFRFRIAIAGCGPAGLAAALALHRDGHLVTLFERFDAPRPLGSGLMLQPSGMAVLDQLGLAHAIARHGARIDALWGLNEHGRTALDAPYAALNLHGAFGIGIHRASLFKVLYEAALAEGIEVRTGHEVSAIEKEVKGSRLVFADGSKSDPFDLAVDACGWYSRIEQGEDRKILPFGALWASIPVRKGDGYAHNKLEQRYRRAHQMVGVLPIGQRDDASSDEVAFFWSLRGSDFDKWRAAPIEDWKSEVRQLWPQIDFLLERIGSHDDLTFARYSHRTASSPYSSNTIRIGDSWHSASPQLGQGANMALLDAWGLAAGLREGQTLSEGLRLAHHWRSDHVALYQLVTAAFTPMFQSDAGIWPWMRDRILAPMSKLGPVAKIQAQLMSGLFGSPLQQLGLELPDYSAIASSIATRASSPSQ